MLSSHSLECYRCSLVLHSAHIDFPTILKTAVKHCILSGCVNIWNYQGWFQNLRIHVVLCSWIAHNKGQPVAKYLVHLNPSRAYLVYISHKLKTGTRNCIDLQYWGALSYKLYGKHFRMSPACQGTKDHPVLALKGFEILTTWLRAIMWHRHHRNWQMFSPFFTTFIMKDFDHLIGNRLVRQWFTLDSSVDLDQNQPNWGQFFGNTVGFCRKMRW